MAKAALRVTTAVLLGVWMLLACSRTLAATTLAQPLIAAEPTDLDDEWRGDPQVLTPPFLRLPEMDNDFFLVCGLVPPVAERAFVTIPALHRKLLPRGNCDAPPSH